MIYHLNGILEYCEPSFCVIDCAGVGYKLAITENTYGSVVGHVGEKMKLLTYLQVREDDVELYGFKTNDELSAFKLLITVSGVGPKAAISILSLMTPDRLATAICTDDYKAIAKANNIGPKTAQRVVLELKDKMAKQVFAANVSVNGGGATPSVNMGAGSNLSEALDALIVLGYTKQDAQRALVGIDPNLSVEKIIPLALNKLMR